jgi:hypothetical protein
VPESGRRLGLGSKAYDFVSLRLRKQGRLRHQSVETCGRFLWYCSAVLSPAVVFEAEMVSDRKKFMRQKLVALSVSLAAVAPLEIRNFKRDKL